MKKKSRTRYVNSIIIVADWLKVVTSMCAAYQLEVWVTSNNRWDGGATIRRVNRKEVLNGGTRRHEQNHQLFFFFTVAFQLLAHILQIHTHKHQTGTTNLFIRNSFPSGRQSTVIRWWDVLTWDFLTQVVLICIFIFFDSIVFLLFLTVHPSACLSQLFYSFAVAVTTAFILCLRTFFVDGLYMKVIHSTSLCTVRYQLLDFWKIFNRNCM